MSAAVHPPLTLEAFLAWEELQEFRHEFDGFQVVAMTGGTLAHATIQSNLAISVGGRLRGTPCRFLGSDIKVVTATTSRYPDGLVTCTPGRNDSTLAPDPVVIFEVLSRSTASTDHITKNREYAAIASVQRYVLLEQERIGATVFARTGNDWLGHVLIDHDVLFLPEIGIELPLAELYTNLDLTPPASPSPAGGRGPG